MTDTRPTEGTAMSPEPPNMTTLSDELREGASILVDMFGGKLPPRIKQIVERLRSAATALEGKGEPGTKFEVVEITVRRFYQSDEAEMALSTKFDVTPTEAPRDWGAIMDHMIARVAEQLDGLPLTTVREMTLPEVEDYRGRYEGEE